MDLLKESLGLIENERDPHEIMKAVYFLWYSREKFILLEICPTIEGETVFNLNSFENNFKYYLTNGKIESCLN